MAKEERAVVAFPKPKKRRKNRSAKKKRDNRYCPERLNYLHGKPCCVCRKPGDVHHVHDGGEPPDDFKTIPLCFRHHQGDNGLHIHGRDYWSEWYGTPESHLAKTNALLIKAGLGRLVKK